MIALGTNTDLSTSEEKHGIPGPERFKLNNLIFHFLTANPRQVIQPLGVLLRLEFTEIINVNEQN